MHHVTSLASAASTAMVDVKEQDIIFYDVDESGNELIFEAEEAKEVLKRSMNLEQFAEDVDEGVHYFIQNPQHHLAEFWRCSIWSAISYLCRVGVTLCICIQQ